MQPFTLKVCLLGPPQFLLDGHLLDGVDRSHKLVYIHAIDEGWSLGIHGLISFLSYCDV